MERLHSLKHLSSNEKQTEEKSHLALKSSSKKPFTVQRIAVIHMKETGKYNQLAKLDCEVPRTE